VSYKQGPSNSHRSFQIKKKRQINSIGPGKALVVAFYWEESLLPEGVFWEDSPFILFETSEPSQQGNFTNWANFYAFNGNVPILAGTVYGDRCDDYVGLSDSEISDMALEKLRTRFGSDRVPDPSNYIVKNWATDEFTLGAYSYNRVGIKCGERELAGSSINDLLFFAGEAYTSQYPGSENGALMTGLKVGEEIANSIDDDLGALCSFFHNSVLNTLFCVDSLKIGEDIANSLDDDDDDDDDNALCSFFPNTVLNTLYCGV